MPKTHLLLLCCAALMSGCASETPPVVLTRTEVVGCLPPELALLECPMPQATAAEPTQGDVADLLVRLRMALEQCQGNISQLRQYFADCQSAVATSRGAVSEFH